MSAFQGAGEHGAIYSPYGQNIPGADIPYLAGLSGKKQQRTVRKAVIVLSDTEHMLIQVEGIAGNISESKNIGGKLKTFKIP